MLAIESSSKTSSLAWFVDGELRQQESCAFDSARNLFPMVRQIADQQKRKISDIDLVGVCEGPGSFTGLRIGVTMAKTLAYAIGCKLVAVNTLRLLAYQAFRSAADRGPFQSIDVVMDAQRNQFFHARYSLDPNPIEIQPVQIVNRGEIENAEVLEQLVTGPGLAKLDLAANSVVVTDSSVWAPDSESLGSLAIADFAAGSELDFWTLNPKYYRKSAAEEKAETEQSPSADAN